MTGLAGIWNFHKSGDSARRCAIMCEAQAAYGPDDQSIAVLEAAAFGRALLRTLPEDRNDRQPLIGRDRRSMLVADIRIDNRAELFASLNLDDDGETSDAELLLLALDRWQETAIERVIGDFAFAYWSSAHQSLMLARDPSGQRPLHYRTGRNEFAFASMPLGIGAITDFKLVVDEHEVARFIADMPSSEGATFFKGVHKVAPGHVLRVTRESIVARRYWQLPLRDLRFRNEEDYVLALREHLDRATMARLRRAHGKVGAHLSAGIDSSAVATTAARLLRGSGERLTALTSAPRMDFDGPSFPGRIPDESPIAAVTAGLYPNIDHRIIHPSGDSPLDHLEDGRTYQEPVGHPCNYVWWSAINDRARAEGVSVMLTGEAGNLTISAGGIGTLSEFIRKPRLQRWAREATQALSGGSLSWMGLLIASFGPWLPAPLWARLYQMRFGSQSSGRGLRLLHPQWRGNFAAEARALARGGDQPPRNQVELRWRHLQSADRGNGRKGVLARWRIDERDPTSDRRLADFCLALPAEQMLRDGVTRRLARLAFADRLPPEVLAGVRGYQYADWYESIDRHQLKFLVSVLAADRTVSELIDVEHLINLVKSWPPGDWVNPSIIATYRLAMLRALSAATFIAANAPRRP